MSSTNWRVMLLYANRTQECEFYSTILEVSHCSNVGLDPSQVSCFDRIWEADALFNKSEEEDIKRIVDVLQRQNQLSPCVLRDPDVLVDPYLHCFVRGRSFSKASIRNFFEATDYTYSPTFCMLPAEVETPVESASVIYNSYINGVNPALSDVYTTLGIVLKRLLRLFENVLTTLHRSNPLPERIVGTYKYKVWDEPEPPDDSDDEEAWALYAHDLRDWTLKRPVDIPDIPQEGYQGQITHINHRVNLNDRRIQVIHKIVDISLVRAFIPALRLYYAKTGT